MNACRTLHRRSLVSSLEVLETRIAPANTSLVANVEQPASPVVTLDLSDAFYGPEVAHNAPVTYHFFVENNGDAAAPGLLLHFVFPQQANTAGLTNPGWSDDDNDGTYQYPVGNLGPGSSASASFTVRAGGSIGDTDLDSMVVTGFVTYDGSAAGDSNLSDVEVTPVYQGIYAVASGVAKPGHFATTEVRIFDVHTGEPADLDWLDENGAFRAYPDVLVRGRFVPVRDSVRVAVADFNGDGFDDIVTATAHGVGPVKIFDGITGTVIKEIVPFNGKKGLFVAAGDLNNDLTPDLVLGSALGGGSVKAYNGRDFAPIGETFTPFGKGFKGGVRVAIANLDPSGGEGFSPGEIIAAQGNFGNRVNVYNLHFHDDSDFPFGSTNATFQLRDSFTAGGAKYRGGLNVSAGDLDGDGRAEIVVGRNRLSSAIIDVFGLARENGDGQPPRVGEGPHFVNLRHFTAFNAAFKQGVRVAVTDVDGDGIQDIVAAAGFSGGGRVRVYLGQAGSATEFDRANEALEFQYDPALAFKAFAGNQPAIWASGTSPISFARRDVDYSEQPE